LLLKSVYVPFDYSSDVYGVAPRGDKNNGVSTVADKSNCGSPPTAKRQCSLIVYMYLPV